MCVNILKLYMEIGMGEFLTCAEYESIAQKLSFPTQAFINGSFVNSLSGKTMQTVNPATGKVLAEVASCDENDVNLAVSIAKETFESGVWSQMHPSERKKILLKLAHLIEANKTELAVLESIDSGKPIRECLLTDIPEAIHSIEWHAAYAEASYGSLSPSGAHAVGLIAREACGVVAAVLPWNFPILMAIWKMAPALATGNSVLLKPASITSLTCLKIAEYAKQAGIPDGVLNVITGQGSIIGRAIGLHNDISVISFTGSTEVGKLFLNYSASSNLKRVVLELGGKSPFVVLEDVTDFDFVASHAVNAAFWNMGENCTANSRIIIPSKNKDKFLSAFLKQLETWKMGNPLDPENSLGSMVSQGQFNTVMEYIAKGKKEGDLLITGGNACNIGSGLFIEPTVFECKNRNSTITQEEIFGPVTSIICVDSDEEAIELANDTEYGLQASLFTENITKAHVFASRLKAGTVSVNNFSEGDNSTPFGGYKLSGFGGKDKARESHDQYVNIKTIFINLDR